MGEQTLLDRHIPVHRDGRTTPDRAEQNLNHDERNRDVDRHNLDDEMLAQP